MDFFLSRYRNLTVLLIVIAAQLLLIAYQVKSNRDVPMLRVWAVSTVTPAEQALDFVRRYTWGFVEDYFVLLGVRGENEKLKQQNGELKLENQYLKSEVSTADRVRALSVFQANTPSKMIPARITGNGTGANSKVVFIDRGTASGIESGMAVVTPDGIVGKVLQAYPMAAMVMLITDGNFAAGVISQKNRVRGTLKGLGTTECQVDHVQNEENVDPGEWFYTSGEDRIFPKGFPVGQATAVRTGKTFKEIRVSPTGLQGGLDEVLIVLQGVHQQIPDSESASQNYKILPAPAESAQEATQGTGPPAVLATDADRLREQYKQSGDTQHHTFGEGTPGSIPPDFTKIPGVRAGAPPPTPSKNVPPKPGTPQPAATAGATAPGAPTSPASAKPGTPGATTPAGSVAPGSAPATKSVAKTKPEPAVPIPPAKPRPRTPILVTDPTDADPGADAVPPPKSKQPPRPPNQ
ncbi:MAG TPA: rod shape-determining protein MreC [Bryobacteraceae bacterium]|nr:rod shape-determining protein MreC [Bryobacteraceae bacterium]